MPPPIRHTIAPVHPEAHLFEVTCTVADPDPAGQVFSLPAWIPGSYMIREFARNIVTLRAESGGKPVPVIKTDKHTWRAAPVRAPLVLTYTVYAWDLSVRTAHLDATHAFFNGTSVFLRVEGRDARPQIVDIRPPAGEAYAGWQVATALPEAVGEAGVAPRHGFGLYRAADYDELIDHPVEMGRFTLLSFEACGVPHEVAITGRHDCDGERLVADLQRICEWQIRLFGEPAPVERYVFLVMAVGEGYGGLEHRASTALLCSRDDLPYAGMQGQPDAYVSFLGLCSHEYFHTWNVKRIKPAAFSPYDLKRENFTRLLWAFEGFTSYYDDLALLRTGTISVPTYLGLLAKTISNVEKSSGRMKQSVAESSFDAWIKYYRQDENSPNAIVSYYAKGALIALALDLRLRLQTDGATSLDDVMRALWQAHGLTGKGVPEDGIYEIVTQFGGLAMARWLRQQVEGTEDLPLGRLLAGVGITLHREAASKLPSLGARTAAEGDAVKLTQVFDGGAAQLAGLSAGDVLLALDGLRVTSANLDKRLARHAAGNKMAVHAFRRDELMQMVLVLQPPPADSVKLDLATRVRGSVAALRGAWLGEAGGQK
ncbi:MAG: M61 family metallopeptidase [Zoogloea sp.]|nr:M61 family metallopeptidase [Zoogloea sp.]